MQTNHIANLLGIKDPNIKITGTFYQKIIKNINCNVIIGKLDQPIRKCLNKECGSTSKIHIHGIKTSLILIGECNYLKSYLKLIKTRYKCNTCNCTYLAPSSLIDKHCFISNDVKLHLAMALTKKLSIKDIAVDHNVSSNTVIRTIDKYYDDYNPNKSILPEVLCFDEFASTKTASNKMAFICQDGLTGKIINILEDRKLDNLIRYFHQYERKARLMVKYVVIDMYKPYITLIKTLFPNAQIVFDKFHIVNLINRSLNKTRIKLMNENKQYYNKLKRYWKLLLKNRDNLNHNDSNYCPCFKNYFTESQIIMNLLAMDSVLKSTYEKYQEILSAIKNKDASYINSNNLMNNIEKCSEYMKTSVKTINKYADYINNCIITDYSNGKLEGSNNKIKVLKRVSFGFRSFHNFKKRILIAFNLINISNS